MTMSSMKRSCDIMGDIMCDIKTTAQMGGPVILSGGML